MCISFCFWHQWCIIKLCVTISVTVLNMGQAQPSSDKAKGIQKVNVTVGDNATLVFPDYVTKSQGCIINRYEIWARGRDHIKKIFASKSANGSNAICVGDCNIYSNRGSILAGSKNITFTLVNVTRADQRSYCLKVKCSGSDDINNNCDEMRSLVIVEMKRKSSLFNKKGSKFKEKVKPTQHDQGGRSQNSKGEKINGCMLLLTISVIITVLLLM